MTGNFVHLHNHTEYSLLDGAIRVSDLVNKASELDMPAVAITDHGVLYGVIEFYRQARKNKIKPIIGCEVYLTPGSRFDKNTRERYHLVLLARNNEGYHNLIKIVSKSWLEGFYYKPRVDRDLLYEHREGLICLSACLQGEIPRQILNKNKEKVEEIIRDYTAIFGRENFFLELQDHHLPEQKKVNSKLIQLSTKLDIPLVVTNDVHYFNREDADLHDVLLALQTGKTVEDENRMRFPNDNFYFKDGDEMKALFPELESAWENTQKIAENCEVKIDFNQFYLPDYPEQKEAESPAELLRNKCRSGLEKKGLLGDKEAEERLEYELGIIEEMGYVAYFLIVQDFIEYAENNGIRVGPGRGSAAGSLVSYLLGITKINPLKYGLLFERFLNPERITMPDIDIDFDERRDEIIEYVRKRYGQEKVAQIGTFGTMAARAAVRDVGRVLNVPYKKVDRLAKMIPGKPGITLDEALKDSEKLAGYYQRDEQVKKIIDFARGLEGMPRHISTHAAGVIIGPEELINIIPLQFKDESVITQLTMDELEDLGLLKMDFLGLRNLTVIGKTLKLIEKNRDKKVDIDNIPLDDPAVYKTLQQGNTLGVFQMESYLFQDLNRRLRPTEFKDLIALLALGRPGPLGSNLVDDYIKSSHGEKKPEYLHPRLKPILEETFGLILYQEQVMQIASDLAGYSLGEADILRRGMGKKKKELVARERERFVKRAAGNGIDREIAHAIYDQMEYFAGYGFNKSHSAAYALVAYQTAYLKVNYPVEFMAAILSSVMNNLDKIGVYIQEARDMDLLVLEPDVNESGYEFEPVPGENNIRFGLKAIKNVGDNAIIAIIEGRQQETYSSLSDFLKKVDLGEVNVKVVEALIKAGAFDSFGTYRSQMLIKYEELHERYHVSRKNHSKGQRSFFDLFNEDEEFFVDDVEYPEINQLSAEEKLNQEKEFLGIYLSGHPLDRFQEKIKKYSNINCQQLNEVEGKRNAAFAGIIVNNKEHITKRNNRMAFMTVEDRTGRVDVVVFPDLYERLEIAEIPGSRVLVTGDKNDDSLIARNILILDKTFLEIDISGLDDTDLRKLKKLLSSSSGDLPVLLRKDNSIIISGREYWVNNNEAFKQNLTGITGENGFKYI